MKSHIVSIRISSETLASAITALRCEGLTPLSPSLAAKAAIERYVQVMRLSDVIANHPLSEEDCDRIITSVDLKQPQQPVASVAVEFAQQSASIAALMRKELDIERR